MVQYISQNALEGLILAWFYFSYVQNRKCMTGFHSFVRQINCKYFTRISIVGLLHIQFLWWYKQLALL